MLTLPLSEPVDRRISTGTHGPTCICRANLTPLSLQAYWGHAGAVFPETLSIFGLFPSSSVGYGCDRRFGADWPAGSVGHKPKWYIRCAYLRYHYNNVIEVTAAMLAYYRHTGNGTFAAQTLLPLAHEVAAFFYSHYQDWDGTLSRGR